MMANDIGWSFLEKPFIHYNDRDLQLAFARYASDKILGGPQSLQQFLTLVSARTLRSWCVLGITKA